MISLNTRQLGKKLRQIFVVCFLLACGGIVVIGIAAVAFLLLTFPGFDTHVAFVDRIGDAAKGRMAGSWPPALDPAAVGAVSHQLDVSKDSYSSWTHARLSETEAKTWGDFVHSTQEHDSMELLNSSIGRVEGVHLSVDAKSQREYWWSDEAPTWWQPPAGEVRATLVMVWRDDWSNIGRASYSAYDPATSTLWIHEFAYQHEQLWAPGLSPIGQRFGGTN